MPGSINRYLREYQREGIKFLFRQYAANQGAILADDMGLGKVASDACPPCNFMCQPARSPVEGLVIIAMYA